MLELKERDPEAAQRIISRLADGFPKGNLSTVKGFQGKTLKREGCGNALQEFLTDK